MNAGTCWSDICIYIRLRDLLASLLVREGNWSHATVQCLMLSDTYTRQISLYWDCRVTVLASAISVAGSMYSHLYNVGAIRLLSRSNSTKRGVALFISAVFRVTSRLDFRLIRPVLIARWLACERVLPLTFYLSRSPYTFFFACKWTKKLDRAGKARNDCERRLHARPIAATCSSARKNPSTWNQIVDTDWSRYPRRHIISITRRYSRPVY